MTHTRIDMLHSPPILPLLRKDITLNFTLLQLGTSSCKALILSAILSRRSCKTKSYPSKANTNSLYNITDINTHIAGDSSYTLSYAMRIRGLPSSSSYPRANSRWMGHSYRCTTRRLPLKTLSFQPRQ